MKRSKKVKPVLTVSLRRRHILAIVLVIFAAIFGYSLYFKFFMVLPQPSINLMNELPTTLENQKILVFSPHCDDEILGAGGLIHRAIQMKSDVRVVIVTDCNKHKIGATRKNESTNALKVLGLDYQHISFLNFPEGVEKRDPEEVKAMQEAISKEINIFSPTLIVAPHPDDTHVDHKLVGQLIIKAVQGKSNIQIIYYLVHYNFLKFPSPPGLRPDAYLLPPARLVSFTDRWYKLSLTADEENLKEEAVFKYRSQLKRTNPILERILLDFVRKNELFMIKQ
jgi:LmbE family N-acetylglucosaminyl deacetylase